MIQKSLVLVLVTIVASFSVSCSSLRHSPASNATAAASRPGFPIVQGLTNKSGTQIAVVAPAGLNLLFAAFEKPKTETSSAAVLPLEVKATVHTSTKGSVVVHHLQIENLKLGHEYNLEVRDMAGKVLDQRTFHTLDTSVRPVRVISASCLYDYYLKESVAMWKALLEEKPDLLLLIGDNVYAEAGGTRFKSPLAEDALWIRYNETFQVLDFYRASTLVPTLVTWDDHDYGMHDGDLTNPHKLEAKKVLEAFFAQTPSPAFPEFSTGPGVSSKFDAFGYRFLMLDDRSFRTVSDKKAASGEQSHFGSEQEKWIVKNVKDSKTPVWLISGDQWFGGYHRFESYEGSHPKSFKTFLESIRGTKQPVMFMSGDRHLSEAMRVEKNLLGYETFEFTSSSLHSTTHPSGWEKTPNPRQIYGVDLKHNFNVFDLTPVQKDRRIRIKGAAIGAESKHLYDFDVEVRR